jgi:hypothetical protein
MAWAEKGGNNVVPGHIHFFQSFVKNKQIRFDSEVSLCVHPTTPCRALAFGGRFRGIDSGIVPGAG